MDKSISENLIILLAEDDQGHAALVKKNLWRLCVDAKILHFSNGERLLEYLDGQPHEGEVFEAGRYVVLLDIKMPGMDGIETLHAIKSMPSMAPVPVIMLTTTSNPAEINHCYEEGCDFYIVKPSDYGEFMEAIAYLGSFLSLPTLQIPQVSPSMDA